MAITRGAVAGPVFAGTPPAVLGSLTLILGAPMSGQVLVTLTGYHINGIQPSNVTVTDTHGNLYTSHFLTQPALEHSPFQVAFFTTDLTRGIALAAGDTITATFSFGTDPEIAGLQATEYHGLDVGSAATIASGRWRTFQQGSTTFSGFAVAPGAGGGDGALGFSVLLIDPSGDGNPAKTFTPDDPTTGPPFLASGGPHSFVASGNTGAVLHAFGYYSYDQIGLGGNQGGAWSPVVANDNYIGAAIGFGPLLLGGLSLARSSAGFMFAAWNDREQVLVARSTDQGATWQYRIVAFDAANDASPWLCIDRRTDDLFLLYHSAANFVSVWRLPGLLEESPVQIITANPYTFPCACIPRPGLMVIAAFDGTTLKAFQSLDYGQTMMQVETFGVQAVERPALILDRHDGMHLFYRTTGDQLFNDYCASPVGDGWQGGTLFANPGKYPGCAAGPLDAFVTWFGTADALHIARLQPDYHVLSDLVGLPTQAFLPISPGTWIDEKDGWWFFGRKNTFSVGTPPPPGYPPGDTGGGGILVGSPGGGGGITGDGSGFEGAALGAIGMDPF